MRLRKPCIDHGLYDDHFVAGSICGGEFLPEDALRYWVTRTDGEPMGEFGGLMTYSMDEAKMMIREELEIERDRIDGFEDEDFQLPTYLVEVSAVVESVTLAASQVGEPGPAKGKAQPCLICGHWCCEMRQEPLHDGFFNPLECPSCKREIAADQVGEPG